jgi:hypothetical protein
MNDGPVKAADTKVDKFGQLFDIRASERERLFERDNTKLLAELKHRDRPRYEQLIDALRANKVPRLTELDRHVDTVIRNAVKAAAEKKAEQATDDFDRDEKGRILPTQGNIRLAIGKLGVRLRYDKFRGLPIIEGLDGFGPTLDDQAMNRLWLSLDSEFGFRPTLQFFQIVASDACLLDQFHPVIEYLSVAHPGDVEGGGHRGVRALHSRRMIVAAIRYRGGQSCVSLSRYWPAQAARVAGLRGVVQFSSSRALLRFLGVRLVIVVSPCSLRSLSLESRRRRSETGRPRGLADAVVGDVLR